LTLATPENVETVGDAGIAYADEADLVYKLQRVLRDGSLVHAYRHRAQARVQRHYDWEHVVDRYEQLFARMAGLHKSLAIPAETSAESLEAIETGSKATVQKSP
jgi:glycosyltransferase involved in cell wall biosynthesis